jgi:hypothetical protein
MSDIDAIKEQIEKTETILAESRENFEKNPGEYSAQLLLMSTENQMAYPPQAIRHVTKPDVRL